MSFTEDIDSGHLDRVTALHINYDGTRMLTASIDHRVKVWNIDPPSGERTLVETFRAHDADIRDAKWFHPSTGSHLATVGNDLKCHIWQEDTCQAPNSGRRFRCIYTISSKPRVPFVSLDIRNIDNVYTVLALIDRQGLLSIYEPTNPDEFKDWTLVDQFNVCVPAPGRGDLTCFKVRFDQNVIPLPYINSLSDDRRQLSLVVAALNDVKIYRSVNTTDGSAPAESATGSYGSTIDAASRRFTFYEAAKLATHPALVRDVQWAPFNIRGFDLIATACKDGAVRIFEIAILEGGRHDSRTASQSSTTNTNPKPSTLSAARHHQPAQSSLTSAITARGQQTTTNSANDIANAPQPNQPSNPNTANTANNTNNTNNNDTTPPHPRTSHKFPYTTLATLSTCLPHAHDDAWSLAWDHSGQVLLSSGSDGVTKIWRKAVLDSGLVGGGDRADYRNGKNGNAGGGEGRGSGGGKWMLFADQAVDLGGGYGGDGTLGTEDEDSGEGEGQDGE